MKLVENGDKRCHSYYDYHRSTSPDRKRVAEPISPFGCLHLTPTTLQVPNHGNYTGRFRNDVDG